MKKKRIVSALLVLAMGVSLLAGCGSGKTAKETKGKETVVVAL